MSALVCSAALLALVAPQEQEADEVRQVRVQSRKSDGLTATGRTIDADTISTTPKRSAEDLLRLVPGVHIVQHGSQGKGYQFYLRGFDAAHGSDVEIHAEDIPLNEPSNVHAHGYLDLAFLIPEAVIAVDAQKGPFRLGQGNFATAGSIRYRLGVPKSQRGTRTLYEIGSTNRHRVAVIHAPRRRSEETFVALEALHDRSYGQTRQAQRLSALSQIRLWERGGAYVDALGSVYGARFGLPGTVRLDDYNADRIRFDDAYVLDTDGESARALGGVRFGIDRGAVTVKTGVYGKARRLDLDENFTGDLQFPRFGDRHRQLQDSLALGAFAEFAYRIHAAAQLVFVGSWQGNLIDQREDRLTPEEQIWETSRDLEIQQQAFGVGPGLRLLPTDWLLIDGGARFDAFNVHVTDGLQGGRRFRDTKVQVSPRVATRASIGERWQLFGAYGRGLRSPEARAFTLPPEPPENEDLSRFAGGQPEITATENVELGARVQPSALFDIGAAVFGTWIARESIFDHVSGFNVELGRTRRAGVEADVQIRPTSWLGFGADFTAVHARFTESGDPIPGAPPIITSVFGNLAHPHGYRAGLRWWLLGPRPLSYGGQAGVVTVMDLSAGYRLRWFQVDLAVDNVLGLRWREGEYHFASHWNPSAGPSQIPSIHYIAGYPRTARLMLSAWF